VIGAPACRQPRVALEIASLPEQIRGYGHVKERNLVAARTRWSELMAKWRNPQGQRAAA
jgi:indolepyruvate ferredoxin oxidoreductase